MDQLDKSNPTGVTESDKRRWKAEALFCRALYHFMLLESYGPIPLVTEHYNQNLDKKDFPGRSHFDVCVDSIAEWFDRAAFESAIVGLCRLPPVEWLIPLFKLEEH